MTRFFRYDFTALTQLTLRKPKFQQNAVSFYSKFTETISPRIEQLVFEFCADQQSHRHAVEGTADQMESIRYYISRAKTCFYD